jgi:hypothetical protein
MLRIIGRIEQILDTDEARHTGEQEQRRRHLADLLDEISYEAVEIALQ